MIIFYIHRERHIKCYRAITLKLLIISKNVSDKSFSVREGRHTGPPFFLSVAKYVNNRKIETYRNNHFQRIH